MLNDRNVLNVWNDWNHLNAYVDDSCRYRTSALGKPYASTIIFIHSGDLW